MIFVTAALIGQFIIIVTMMVVVWRIVPRLDDLEARLDDEVRASIQADEITASLEVVVAKLIGGQSSAASIRIPLTTDH